MAEVLILRHAESMLPDEHKVWPEGPGKNIKGTLAINQYLTSYITLCPISKAQNREGVFGATWAKPLILLLFFYELETRYYGTSQKRSEEQISEIPLLL